MTIRAQSRSGVLVTRSQRYYRGSRFPVTAPTRHIRLIWRDAVRACHRSGRTSCKPAGALCGPLAPLCTVAG
jgi:hypothetical protein